MGQLSCLLEAKDRPAKWRVSLDSWVCVWGWGGSQVILGVVEELWTRLAGWRRPAGDLSPTLLASH